MDTAASKYAVRVAARNWAQDLVDEPPSKYEDALVGYRALAQLADVLNTWYADEKRANRGYAPDRAPAERSARVRFDRHMDILNMLYTPQDQAEVKVT